MTHVNRKLQRSLSCGLLAVVALLAAACSGGRTPVTRNASSSPAPPPFVGADAPPATPQGSLRAAVSALLAAEQRGDHTASFALLSDEARAHYVNIHEWKDRRNELPFVTGFQLQGAGGGPSTFVAVVDHTPGLDPFRGLSAARDRETWTGRQEHGGWLVDADPVTQLVLPSDATASAAALAWARSAERCDQAGTKSHQAVDPLLGVATAPVQLCGHDVPLSAGVPRHVTGTSATQDLVAQYSSDSLGWARAVTVTGADHPFDAVLAPIGDEWQVVGVFTGP